MKWDLFSANKLKNQKGDNMKIIITTIILTLFSSLSFADGHTSGKFNASGMGAVSYTHLPLPTTPYV